MDRYYRIGEVSKLLGVDRHVLRFWEQEFPDKVRTTRNHGGQRVYSPRDVAMLAVIRDLSATGFYTLRGIRWQLGMNIVSPYIEVGDAAE